MMVHLRSAPAPDPQGAAVQAPYTFEEFFETHRRKLFGSFCVVTGNRQEAEEIVQEAFMRVWERWDRVSTLEDPVGFLFRTAMNLFRNRARRAALAFRKSVGTASTVDDLAAVEDRDELARAMHALTARQRAALVLTHYLGYSSEEAGSLLGIKASTVRALSTKARDTVRAMEGSA